MTIYEQIQDAIDFVEANLFEVVGVDVAASSASMSPSSFHRYFPALTGYSFGEYVRKRRLSEALETLMRTDVSVLEIALRTGYDSHEAFTRAFKREFGVAPFRFRTGGLSAARTEKLNLVGDVMMGVLTKTLPEMAVVCFDGFRPEPEYEAQRLMVEWMSRHADLAGSCRSFGHNIDLSGNLSHEPDNAGYRLMATVPDHAVALETDTPFRKIRPGVFVVTGIEGSFDDDPSGSWITEGWRRLQVMVERQGLRVHPSGRWFEEWLEPAIPGRWRFDLYLEIEKESSESNEPA
ncbi:MAG: helix-turn-helix transcriptional regulator [Acidimicrobiia bacterium]|nr:helix-turn-helix transcriptional regulator [Acidimicrobiia bacterium]